MGRQWRIWLACWTLLALTSSWSSKAEKLNDYILDYQAVEFDHAHLHSQHDRVKRSLNTHISWTFKAFGRMFKLKLKPAESMFAPDHVLVFGSNEPEKVDTSVFYDGFLKDVPGSSAHLAINNIGVTGHVKVPGDTIYHIEPARNHLKDSKFHTIIYPESKMNLDPYKHLRQGSCGSAELYEKLANMSRPVDSQKKTNKEVFYDSVPRSYNKYSAEANERDHRGRKRRAVPTGNLLDSTQNTCFMALQADALLYEHTLSKYRSGAGGGQTPENQAKEELLTLFNNHVKALNEIYTTTQFEPQDDNKAYFLGVRFQLQRSTIITGCDENIWKEGYCRDNLDVSNFLDLTSRTEHNEFCLVHTFTYRDFVGGTLGLAWVASPESASAGFCGTYGNVRDDNGVSMKSLNTGVVTLINFQRAVPARVSQLTFAHEVGHNFGAKHDATEQCAPYGTNLPDASKGNYIMFPSATQGYLPNNAKFSPCSKDYIFQVLNRMSPRGPRNNCFKASNAAFCGNKLTEEGEECDCGYAQECEDQCCNGRDPDNNNSCQLKSPAKCSPTAGSCCNSTCDFFARGHTCQEATECSMVSVCNGTSAECPTPEFKKNYEDFCEGASRVCENGQCLGSVCRKINWTECFKSSADGASDEEMCYVSCKKDENSPCISSYNWNDVVAEPDFRRLIEEIKNVTGDTSMNKGVQSIAGDYCDNLKGICDNFGKCQKVDAEGPFRQLTNLIFDPVTLNNIREWIVDHWWAVLLMSVGVVVFMGVFVKIFSYNTPSKNPNAPARPASAQPAATRPRSQPDKPSPYTVASAPPDYNTFAYTNDGYTLDAGPSNYRSSQSSHMSSVPVTKF